MQQNETLLYKAGMKRLLDNTHLDFYMELLWGFPEGEWFQPTNRENEAFTVCIILAEAGLIAKKQEPLWHNGSFTGYRISYLYKYDLNY